MQDRRAAEQLLNANAPPKPEPGTLPGDLARQATDLSEVKQSAEKARIEAEQREEARRQVIVRRWDGKMQRAFKGIFTRKQRHLMLFESSKRAEAAS